MSASLIRRKYPKKYTKKSPWLTPSCGDFLFRYQTWRSALSLHFRHLTRTSTAFCLQVFTSRTTSSRPFLASSRSHPPLHTSPGSKSHFGLWIYSLVEKAATVGETLSCFSPANGTALPSPTSHSATLSVSWQRSSLLSCLHHLLPNTTSQVDRHQGFIDLSLLRHPCGYP